MIPDEAKLVERMKDRPFALVGINSDGAREALKTKLDAKGVTWRNAVDGAPDGPIAKAWNVQSWPTIYVIDDAGVIRATGLRGGALDDEIEKLVSALEAKKSRAR